MPDIREGLETPDPNTDEGFTTLLAEKVGATVPEETLQALRDNDTSVARGLTTRSEETPVAGSETTTEEVPAAGAASEGGETPALDEAVLEYMEKHGGTPEQALSALYQEFTNAQKLIGTQSNEVGELRGRLEGLEKYLQEQAQAAPEPRFDAQIPTSEANEELEMFFEERGPQAAMSWVVENRPDLIEQAIGVWSGIDEVGAARFATRYDRFLDQEMQSSASAGTTESQTSQEDPFLAQLKAQAAFTQAVETARVASGLDGEEWAAVKDEVIPVLNDESTSVLIKKAVAEPSSPEDQVEGLKAVFQIAKAKALAKATTEATASVRSTEEAALAERKKAAMVATGSLTPQQGESGTEGMTEEEASAERVKRFKQQLLDADTTDIASGLTYGQGQKGFPSRL